jgi:hypothetical protein
MTSSMAWITPWEDERSALTTLAPPNVMPPTRSNQKKKMCQRIQAKHYIISRLIRPYRELQQRRRYRQKRLGWDQL